MCKRVMTEELTHARFEADQAFLDPSYTINNGVYDLERFRLLADRIKPLLGPCLEKRINSGLEEFVCKSSSRYSKRFPRLKRCLDAVAAWLNYLDAFRTKDIEEEAIKHAIEYLLKDGRVTHLEDPVVLNAGINRVDLDSLTEQNAMKNRNVWSFIKEKDYWLCHDQEQTTSTCKPPPTINSQIQECKRENSSSDLDVEIGSSKQEVPTKVTCKKIFNKDTCREQKIETKYQCDQEIISCSKQNIVNQSKKASVTINEPKLLQTRENLSKPSTRIPYDLQISCCSKQNNLNPLEEASTIINEPKPLQTRENLPKPSTRIPYDLPISCCSKQNNLNPLEEASTIINEPKPLQTRRNLPKSSTRIPYDLPISCCSKQNNLNPLEEASTIINEPKPLQTRRNLPKSSTRIPYDLPISCCSKQNNLNPLEEASTIINEPKPLQTRRNLPKSSTKISEITFCFKQNSVNPSNEASITTYDPKLLQTRRNILNPSTKLLSNCNENCDQNLCPKSSKLKLVIHKTTNTNRCTLWKSAKVSSLSVPCKSSHLIVRLFEADPSLSDSCLILMKRKFEHDIRNACSCLNDIFKKLDNSTMKRLCLNCQIHPGRIDLNLQRDDGSSKVRLFLARVPICLSVHKRESSCRKNIKSEESQGTNKNLDYCCKEEFQERQIAFYSQCSNHDLMEKKRSPKDIMGKEVNFVWLKKETKEVDFVLSSSFTRSKINEDLEENFISCTKGDCIKVYDEENAGKNNSYANSSITEDDNQRMDDICTYSSSRSSIGQDNSTIGGCDPEQCSCHVLCTNKDKLELENSIKEEKCVTRSENIIEKEDNRLENCPEAEEDISKTKGNDLRVQDFSKLERNIVTVRSSTLQVQKLLITTEISETKKNSEMKETRSIDYISSTVSKNNSKISCDSKCSRCGKDLSEEGSKNITKSFDTETCRTLNSISKRNMNLKESMETPSICSTKTTCRTFIMKNENLSNLCPGNCNKNLINNDRDPEVLESCKCSSNSSTRTNMDTQNFLQKNFNLKSTKFRSNFSKKPCCSSSTSKTRCQTQEDSSYLPSRRKNSFWKRSIVPGSFCSSFPALDRIKYLIRKKLRRLLLEERDKGTGTSKTYLKNDRYLVSISSGKLNEERICSSIRCPFTTRNQVGNQSSQTTFSEGSSLTKKKKKKKKDTFEDGVRDRCRRMIQDNEVFRKIRLREISRFLGQKSGSMMDNHKMIDEKEHCPFYRDGKRRGRSSMESFGSTRVIFFDDLDETKRKNGRKFSKGILKEGIASPNIISRKNCHRRGREGGDALGDERPRPFEKRLFKYYKIEDYDDDNDFMNLLGNYERRISDLDADFRLKLLQYVALCRSVKDLLMKRLPRPDDVYEGSSSSM
nr:uncharacterized protein LOC117605896 isoform X2 [Osmia lignaria]